MASTEHDNQPEKESDPIEVDATAPVEHDPFGFEARALARAGATVRTHADFSARIHDTLPRHVGARGHP